MKERSNQQVIIGLVLGVLGAGVVVGLLLAAAGTGAARWLDPAQRALGLERDQSLQGLRLATTAATETALAGGLVGAVIIGLIWMERRSRQIYPKGGLYPLIRLRADEIIYDPNRGPASSPAALLGALEVQRVQALASAAEGLTVEASARAVQILPAGGPVTENEGNAQMDTLPTSVRIQDICSAPSLEALVVGVALKNGHVAPVTLTIHQLMHSLIVGASGSGKSTWLRAMLWQFAQAPEPLEIWASDISGSEFNGLRNWSRLRYPIAETTAETIGLLGELQEEISRRRALWRAEEDAYDLLSYNQLTGADLPPILFMADEMTHLLNTGGIMEPLREAVQTARQYGVYVMLAGQAATSDVIKTQIRGQFSTRMGFYMERRSSQVLLDDRSASELDVPGRAVAQIERQRTIIQGPYLDRADLTAVIRRGGPSHPAPIPAPTQGDETARRVWALHAGGETDTAIARAVFGHGNTHYIDRVRGILQQQQHKG
jgi:energy-coupling factor transporter ATP-binding protein EcfA2